MISSASWAKNEWHEKQPLSKWKLEAAKKSVKSVWLMGEGVYINVKQNATMRQDNQPDLRHPVLPERMHSRLKYHNQFTANNIIHFTLRRKANYREQKKCTKSYRSISRGNFIIIINQSEKPTWHFFGISWCYIRNWCECWWIDVLSRRSTVTKHNELSVTMLCWRVIVNTVIQ